MFKFINMEFKMIDIDDENEINTFLFHLENDLTKLNKVINWYGGHIIYKCDFVGKPVPDDKIEESWIDVGKLLDFVPNSPQRKLFAERYSAIKDLFGILFETKRRIISKSCKQIAVLSKNDNIVMSMCIFPKIKNAQFHMNICKWLDFLLILPLKGVLNFENGKIFMDRIEHELTCTNLSATLHKCALLKNNTTYAFAPPLNVMCKIIKRNFNYSKLPMLDDESANYNDLGFTQEELELINISWPKCYNYATYMFWN
jgi:hypothetical protein